MQLRTHPFRQITQHLCINRSTTSSADPLSFLGNMNANRKVLKTHNRRSGEAQIAREFASFVKIRKEVRDSCRMVRGLIWRRQLLEKSRRVPQVAAPAASVWDVHLRSVFWLGNCPFS
jgi:hypothetical protein